MGLMTAALLRGITRDVEAIATGRTTGGSAGVAAGRIKGMVDDLVASAIRDKETS